jgi:hypothetical protein
LADLLLTTKPLRLANRQQLSRLLSLLNVQIASDLPWAKLLAPEQLADGVIALHSHDGDFWLQLPTADGGSEWLPSNPDAVRPQFLFPENNRSELLFGQLPRRFWQTLLPELPSDNCQLWPQWQAKLPDHALIVATEQPLRLQLRWAWTETLHPARHLPFHQPARADALYSAALMADSEHCDDNPALIRLWPTSKNKPMIAALQNNQVSALSPLAEFPLKMNAVSSVVGGIASSSSAADWLINAMSSRFESGELLYHSYVNPQRLAQLRGIVLPAQPAVEMQVWWFNNEIVLDLHWSEE